VNDRDAVAAFVDEILDELTEDLDVESPGPDDLLGDLGLESISLVYLIAEVQQKFDLGDRLLDSLRWHPPTDVRVLTVAQFATRAGQVLEALGNRRDAEGRENTVATLASGSSS
jgi:acyl carrier protein